MFHFVSPGSGVSIVLFYKGLKMKMPVVWVLPNIWRLGQIRNTKFGTDVSKEMFLHATKCQSYIFYCFWVIKGKPTNGWGGRYKILPPTQIRVKVRCFQKFWKKKSMCTKLCFHLQIFSVNSFCVYIIQFTFYQGLMVPWSVNSWNWAQL